MFVDCVKIQEPLAAANITNYILTSKYNQVKKEVKHVGGIFGTVTTMKREQFKHVQIGMT